MYLGSPSNLEIALQNQKELKIDPQQKAIEIAINIAFDGPEILQKRLANDVLKSEFEYIKNTNKNLSVISDKLVQHSSTQKPTFGRSFRLVDLGTQLTRQFTVTFIAGWKTFLQQLLFYIGSILILASVFDHSMVLPSGCSTITVTSITSTLSSLIVSWFSGDNSTTSATEITSPCDQTPLTEKFLIIEHINYLAFGRIFQAFPLIINSIAAFGALAKVFRSEHRNSKY